MRGVLTAVAASLVLAGLAQAQSQSQPQSQSQTQPLYRVTVVGHSTPAINYRYRSGETPIDFHGTPLMPRAKGHARVETKRGFSEIDAHFSELEPATKFGPEYLTYVMWAITPEGRAMNLGEILLSGDDSKLHVTTDMQAFALVVTAEPYFAVTQPSDVVVMENAVNSDTTGAVEYVEAKYELLKRGSYVMERGTALSGRTFDPAMPLELREARNAIDLARLAGADKYASDTFQKATQSLQQAEEYQRRDAGRKPVTMMARAAAQTAEDARLIAIQRQLDEQAARTTDAAMQRELNALAAARAEAERARKAETERAAADEARLRAESAADRLAREKADADAQWATAERAKSEAERAKSDAERAKSDAERAKSDAEQASQALAQQKAQADAAREAANAEAAQARSDVQRAEQEKTELRARLRQQLNVILETRESARGLIVNMSDVLFDSGRATLRPGAREKLAKVAGIVLANPGLTLEVEGHTDSVGATDYNQDLSEHRANTVRTFLVEQGIPSTTIAARGFGKTQPVATNGTAAGRQRNRRVELIVSGSPIQ